MRIQSIIIGIIITGLFVAGFGSLLMEGNTYYNTSFSDSDLAGLNKINDTYSFTINASQSLQGGNEQLSQGGTDTSDIKITKSVNVFYQSLGIIPQLVSDVAGILGLPSWFTYGLLAIVILVVTLSILYVIGVLKGGAY